MPVIVGGSVLAGLGCNGRLLMPRISKPSTHGLGCWVVDSRNTIHNQPECGDSVVVKLFIFV